MKITVYTINAFAKTEDGGNPAGIVLNADGLSESQMKKIAGIVGFSETAFVMESTLADYKVRFFTPVDEVDLCGHATIGLYSLMIHKKLILPGNYTQETRAGVLDIQITEEGEVMMQQTRPQFFESIKKDIIADSLQISIDDLDEILVPQIVSTGLRDIMVPIKSRQVLDAIRPDMDRVAKISCEYDTMGYQMFALDTLYQDTAYCRNLAPRYDIPEESATGTANGALASYLLKYGKISEKNKDNLVFEQGYSMGKPSEIKVSLEISNNQIEKVYVGGTSKNIKERVIEFD